jgi:hypothetical protein
MYRKSLCLILLLTFVLASSCMDNTEDSQVEPNPIEEGKYEEIELPMMSITNEEILDPEYILMFDIHRWGHLIDPSQNVEFEDTILLEVKGKQESIFGSAENGKHVMTIYLGDCTQTCESPVGYEVWGAIANSSNGCKLRVVIKRIGFAGVCKTTCLGGTIPYATSVGDIYLDEFDADFSSLRSGVTRNEELGNTQWTSTYTLKKVHGDISKNICVYENP